MSQNEIDAELDRAAERMATEALKLQEDTLMGRFVEKLKYKINKKAEWIGENRVLTLLESKEAEIFELDTAAQSGIFNQSGPTRQEWREWIISKLPERLGS